MGLCANCLQVSGTEPLSVWGSVTGRFFCTLDFANSTWPKAHTAERLYWLSIKWLSWPHSRLSQLEPHNLLSALPPSAINSHSINALCVFGLSLRDRARGLGLGINVLWQPAWPRHMRPPSRCGGHTHTMLPSNRLRFFTPKTWAEHESQTYILDRRQHKERKGARGRVRQRRKDGESEGKAKRARKDTGRKVGVSNRECQRQHGG